MNTKYISNKMRRVKKYKINHKLVKNEYMWRKISQKNYISNGNLWMQENFLMSEEKRKLSSHLHKWTNWSHTKLHKFERLLEKF